MKVTLTLTPSEAEATLACAGGVPTVVRQKLVAAIVAAMPKRRKR